LQEIWDTENAIKINLHDAIPGLAWGMRGMQEGEIREIFLHPSVAYGIYTTLDKGIYLKIEVQLIAMHPSDKDMPFTSLESFDFSQIFSPLNQQSFEEISDNVGYCLGYDIWKHYKKETYYSLNQILDLIKDFKFGRKTLDDSVLKENGESLINRLHWNIYQAG
jgi:hypothetical protein